MDAQREGPLDLDYIEQRWVTKGLDCPCRSKTIIRTLIAELRRIQSQPIIEISPNREISADEVEAFIRRWQEATGTHPHHRVAVVPPRMTVRVRRWWHWPWRRR